MATSNHEEQLALLQVILGKSVRLRDSDELDQEPQKAQTVMTNEELSWEAFQTKESAKTRTSHPKPRSTNSDAQPSSTSYHAVPSNEPASEYSMLETGDMTGSAVEFSPWSLIVAYPSMFIGKTNKPRARPFFDDIFNGRRWDFFYINDPRNPKVQPHFLVPTVQFERFLQEVNEALKISLTIPPGVNEKKFSLKFNTAPRPRFLLQAHRRKDLNRASFPTIAETDVQAFNKAGRLERDSFTSKIAGMAPCSDKAGKKRKAEEKARRRVLERRSMMKKTRAYLGLTGEVTDPRAVFISIDVEALETYPHPVSEIGIAILDIEDARGLSEGPCGKDWWSLIKAYHLRTHEYSHITNQRYLSGCPDAFDFGTSTFPTNQNLENTVQSIWKPYIDTQRDLIIVGHDVVSDIQYMSKIGVDLSSLPGLVCQIDTQALHQLWSNCNNGRSLLNVLYDLRIRSSNLHNAGNDAVYTMRAMIGLAIEESPKAESSEEEYSAYMPDVWDECFGHHGHEVKARQFDASVHIEGST